MNEVAIIPSASLLAQETSSGGTEAYTSPKLSSSHQTQTCSTSDGVCQISQDFVSLLKDKYKNLKSIQSV